jgi:hypothetical protein
VKALFWQAVATAITFDAIVLATLTALAPVAIGTVYAVAAA